MNNETSNTALAQTFNGDKLCAQEYQVNVSESGRFIEEGVEHNVEGRGSGFL
jgi:hypothetical protein